MSNETVGSFHKKNNPPKTYKWLGGIHKLYVTYPYLCHPKGATPDWKRKRPQIIIYNENGTLSLFQEVMDYNTEDLTPELYRVTDTEKYATNLQLCYNKNIDPTSLIGLN